MLVQSVGSGSVGTLLKKESFNQSPGKAPLYF